MKLIRKVQEVAEAIYNGFKAVFVPKKSIISSSYVLKANTLKNNKSQSIITTSTLGSKLHGKRK